MGVKEFTKVHSDYHAQVVDAIAKGDGPAARCVMDYHLEAVSIDMGVLGSETLS